MYGSTPPPPGFVDDISRALFPPLSRSSPGGEGARAHFPNSGWYAFVCIAPHLPFKYGLRNRGSFVRSQPIQKENKRILRTQIVCDPGRNPVSYRKPCFCKRRVWMQVKVKFPWIESICFSVGVLAKFLFSQALLYFIFNWSSVEERCVTTLKTTV